MSRKTNEQNGLTSWLIQNLKTCSDNEFVDLIEIKSRYEAEVSSVAVGNIIKKIFKGVTIKAGRCTGNWSKVTQRYYGF